MATRTLPSGENFIACIFLLVGLEYRFTREPSLTFQPQISVSSSPFSSTSVADVFPSGANSMRLERWSGSTVIVRTSVRFLKSKSRINFGLAKASK